MDSSSDMGLTTRELQSSLTINNLPHYFEVRNIDGNRYCHCGSEKDAKYFCEKYRGFTYEKILLPASPKTVDVPHVTMAPDPELPAQNILPENQQQPLEL